MRTSLLIALVTALTACASVNEEALIARKGNDYVRLTLKACDQLDSFHAGEASIRGQAYRLCWRAMMEPAPHILIVFSDGDVWRVDPASFRKADDAV